MLKPLTKSEKINLLIIFTFLFIVVGLNIKTSLRRGRDSTRKNDLSAMQKAIDLYRQKYKVYPPSNDTGQIVGCFKYGPEFDKKTGLIINGEACEWGKSKFENINTMVMDPSSDKGFSYKYVSDGNSYQIYVSLEGKDEPEYSKAVEELNLHCGSKVCNYGRGSNL